jgi:hypothetical protein
LRALARQCLVEEDTLVVDLRREDGWWQEGVEKAMGGKKAAWVLPPARVLRREQVLKNTLMVALGKGKDLGRGRGKAGGRQLHQGRMRQRGGRTGQHGAQRLT